MAWYDDIVGGHVFTNHMHMYMQVRIQHLLLKLLPEYVFCMHMYSCPINYS